MILMAFIALFYGPIHKYESLPLDNTILFQIVTYLSMIFQLFRFQTENILWNLVPNSAKNYPLKSLNEGIFKNKEIRIEYE